MDHMDNIEPTEQEKKEKTLKDYLPFIIFFLLLFILFLSSALSRKPPQVYKVTPEIAGTGQEVIVEGRFFGKQKFNGRVEVAGISPSSYIEWTEEKIRFVVTEEMKFGLLVVYTKEGGSSQIVPFTNKQYLPLETEGPRSPLSPYINGFIPERGTTGTLITIKGVNFGVEKKNSNVYFSWASGNQPKGVLKADLINMVPASLFDDDYALWSDNQIKVYVPDGATSGKVRVVTQQGESNNVYFEISDTAGAKRFGRKKIFYIQYTIEVRDVVAAGQNHLYIWAHRVLDVPEQRDIKTIIVTPEPEVRKTNGMMLFHLKDLKRGSQNILNISIMFERYEVETKIVPYKIISQYNTGRALYKRYTQSTSEIPASATEIINAAQKAVGWEKNPYQQAKMVYNYVIQLMRFSAYAAERNVLRAIQTGTGNSYSYAAVYCALMRALGIPTRIVAGYVVDNSRGCRQHFWNEFYLEEVGWIPLDTVLGDGEKYGDFPSGVAAREYYFGNMDNNHITLSKGEILPVKMQENGHQVKRTGLADLQVYHEEYSGDISSYSSDWGDFEIQGVY